MRLRVEAIARRDIREIMDAYDNERDGLGDRFFDELTELMSRIREMPLSFPTIGETARRALLVRFPYAVYFRILEGRKVSVVAVFHLRRDPRTLMRRIER